MRIALNLKELDQETAYEDYEQQAVPAELSNEQIAFFLYQKNVTMHAIFDMVEVDYEGWARKGWRTALNLAALTKLAVQRVKMSRDVSVKLSSKIAAATHAGITASAIILKEAGKEAREIPLMRGTPLLEGTNEERAFVRAEHILCAVAQILPPVKVKQQGGAVVCVPQAADSEAFIYPVPPMIPVLVSQTYAGSHDVRSALTNLKCAPRDKDDTVFLNVMKVMPDFLYQASQRSEGKMYRKLISAFAPATEAHRNLYRKKKRPEPNYMPAYASVPKIMSAEVTLPQALKYLCESRKVRGTESKGVGANTSSYYYGDIPSAYQRPVNMAHSIMKLLHGEDNDGVILDKTLSSCLRILSANGVGVYDFDGEFGGVPVIEKKYMWLVDIPRTVTITNRGRFMFNPPITELRERLKATAAKHAALAESYGLTICTAFHVLACDDLFDGDYNMRLSMHAHSGKVWLSPAGDGVQQDISAFKKHFATRLMQANLYKNYYPFHRVPYVQVDDSKFTMVLSVNDKKQDHGIVDYDAIDRDPADMAEDDEVFEKFLSMKSVSIAAAVEGIVAKLGAQVFAPPVEQKFVYETYRVVKENGEQDMAVKPDEVHAEEAPYSYDLFGASGDTAYE